MMTTFLPSAVIVGCSRSPSCTRLAIGPLEHGDHVPGARQLLRCSEPRGSGTDDGDLLARRTRRVHRLDPALVEGAVDELDLDLLDGDGVLVDAQDARRLTGCGAQP